MRSAFVFVGLSLAAFGMADPFYLALGDSVAFGYQPGDMSLSDGDRGYVGPLRDALGNPNFTNLSITGESAVSFGDTSNPARALNSNYLWAGGSQLSRAQSLFGIMKADGSANDTVSFALGANDLFGLLLGGSTPTLGQITATINAVDARYSSFLTALRADLPDAKLILPGYYNPLGASPDPFIKTGTDFAMTSLNAKIQAQAVAHGGIYVDFFGVVKGHELQYTHIGDTPFDVHPTDAGYAALGRAAVQAVPEPTSVMALGLGAFALLRRRRK